jgi:hypothetical protein
LSPLRSTPGAAAIAAAAAGLCLMLGACSGGSATSAANTSAASPGSPASPGTSGSPASPGTAGGTGSAGSAGSAGSTAGAPAAVATAGLTGNFCTDFTHLGQTLAKLPKPTNTSNLAADQATARQFLAAAQATFNGLATEAPPNVAAAIHRITALYQTELANIGTFGSVPQLNKGEHSLSTNTTMLADIRVIVTYMASKCG